jgi:hypothetical protein
VDVDANVYKSGQRSVSLRMLFSHKLENCAVCNDEADRRMDCSGPCGQSGRVVSNFTYKPSVCIVDGRSPNISRDVFDAHHGSVLDIVCNYSIWPESEDVRDDYKVPETDPLHVVPITKKRKDGETSEPKPKATFAPSWIYLQDEIRALEKAWAFLEVSSVQINARQTQAFVNLAGLGSGQCPWSNKNHGPTRLYFVLHKNGRLQLHCKSAKGPNPCNKREPKEYSVSVSTAKRVFGIVVPSLNARA